MLQCSVTENISLTSLGEVSRAGVIDLGAEKELARNEVDRLHIRVASLDQELVNLSGGNQQKVVLARWLAARCRVLLFDEPTRGIDVGAKGEIYELMGELVEHGVAILLISSEMPELIGLSDRVAVMHEGTLQGILSRTEVSQERIMELALQFTAGLAVGWSLRADPCPSLNQTQVFLDVRHGEARSYMPSGRSTRDDAGFS